MCLDLTLQFVSPDGAGKIWLSLSALYSEVFRHGSKVPHVRSYRLWYLTLAVPGEDMGPFLGHWSKGGGFDAAKTTSSRCFHPTFLHIRLTTYLNMCVSQR